MAWVKVPPEHHPLFRAALPADPRVETQQMFGGVAAKVNGHIFAGLFGRSTMVLLPEPDRAAALALEGAERFDPMGDGRARSDKVMLPELMMDDPDALRGWIARAFAAAAALPVKAAKGARASTPTRPTPATKVAATEKTTAKKTATKTAATKTAATKLATKKLATKKAPAKRAAPR